MDFAVARTLLGGILYVHVVMEISSRRIVHINVAAHPTAEWSAQQLRDAIPSEHSNTHLIHDNDAIFSRAVDATIRSFGIDPVRTPIRAPRANAYCERLIGTLRRECLDWIIPLTEGQLRAVVREWPDTTIAPGRTWRSTSQCRSPTRSIQRHSTKGVIGYRRAPASSALQFSAVCITSTASNKLPDATKTALSPRSPETAVPAKLCLHSRFTTLAGRPQSLSAKRRRSDYATNGVRIPDRCRPFASLPPGQSF
jgi:hypothetical protein